MVGSDDVNQGISVIRDCSFKFTDSSTDLISHVNFGCHMFKSTSDLFFLKNHNAQYTELKENVLKTNTIHIKQQCVQMPTVGSPWG